MQRKIEDAGDARACLNAAKAARLTPTEWAREHGVDARSLHAWSVNLASRRHGKPEGEAAGAPRLVELVPAATPAPRPGPARYVVRVGDLEIDLADDFREETLVRLVRSLREC